jgi:hypothetical protein
MNLESTTLVVEHFSQSLARRVLRTPALAGGAREDFDSPFVGI